MQLNQVSKNPGRELATLIQACPKRRYKILAVFYLFDYGKYFMKSKKC
jgi:hypothetical protein